jgi:hypothetical protein
VEDVLRLHHKLCLTAIAYLVDKAEVQQFNMEQSMKK